LRPAPPPPPAPAPAPARPPTRPQTTSVDKLVGGRYQILERIGQGGMGKVYKVSHHQLGKVFALKIISEQMAETDEARDLFFREARLASSLSHPNITSVVDFGEDDELGMFMVMELVEGEPLAKILHREQRLGVRTACEVILQVADALHYIHGKNIVHCDIKTENILIGEVQGTKRRHIQVKLLDFGLARSLSAARQTNSLSGTPHYVAPERIRGEPPSPSTDIYGLGILLYEVLTGKVPWDGHVAQILTGHLELAPTPPSSLVEGGLDPALENLVLHALAKKPADRHRDMAAFIYELRTVMDMLGFGKRGKRGAGGPRRVVIERSKNERDELVRTVFEGCRLPLALITTSGLIVVANPSFAKFVMGVAVDIEGLTVQSTPLAQCWLTFETDLAKATSGSSVRRVLEMDVDGTGREVRRLLMWLDPSAGEHLVLGVQPLEL
jgi:tRNA A-37 threonylcarbamoyl transferase component Bud32